MIHLIWGAPGQGKTYVATAEAISFLKKKGKFRKKVFSNYPIIYHKPLNIFQRSLNMIIKVNNILFKNRKKDLIQKEVLSTIKWEEEYIYAGITNSVIVLDEAYRYFSSRKRDVKADEHSFFATNGHDGNEIYVIAQHYNRIDLIIREMANFYTYVSKMSNPFSLAGSGARDGEPMPLFFRMESYISEDDFKMRRIRPSIYMKKRLWFSKGVASAYDTRYFRKTEPPLNFKTWEEIIAKGILDPKKELEDREIKEWAKSGLP